MPASSDPSMSDAFLDFVRSNGPMLAVALVVIVSVQLLFMSRMFSSPPPAFLDPTEFKPLPLTSKTNINHNTVMLRFEFDKGQRIGLPIGQHISFKSAGEDGKDVYRSYTPVSDDALLGAVEFVIKLYPTGKMSQIISKLQVGESMMMKGPKGRLQYKPNMKKHIGMVAGGSGITPMYQDASDKTQVSLVFGNVSEEDILLRSELDALATANPSRLSIRYLLNAPPEGWTGGVGFVNADVVKTYLPAPSDDCMTLYCGPPPMVEAVKKCLEEVGYQADQLFGF
eukprot:gene5077-34875_t